MTNNQAKQILAMIKQAKVEWKPLGEVAELQRGKTITAKQATLGNIPVISGGQKPAYFTGDYNRNGETITVAGSGAYAGFVMYWNEPIFVGDAFSVKPNSSLLITKYVYHFLLQNQNKIYGMKKGSGVPHVYPKDLATLEIPIPPLELQKEIVRILDTFTALTSELTLRQKQYQYYRDLLLSENELAKAGFEWKSLGDITNLKRGKRLVRSELAEIGEYAVYQNSLQPLGYYHQANCPANSTFIITAGAAGEIGYSTVEFWAADDCYYLECPKGILNDRFLYHVLINQQQKILTQVRKASIPRLGRNSIENIKIPIPPLDTQAKIVAILDKFDCLTNSITDGLPKEIELRRKQYEYYRELLLGFDKN